MISIINYPYNTPRTRFQARRWQIIGIDYGWFAATISSPSLIAGRLIPNTILLKRVKKFVGGFNSCSLQCRLRTHLFTIACRLQHIIERKKNILKIFILSNHCVRNFTMSYDNVGFSPTEAIIFHESFPHYLFEWIRSR